MTSVLPIGFVNVGFVFILLEEVHEIVEAVVEFVVAVFYCCWDWFFTSWCNVVEFRCITEIAYVMLILWVFSNRLGFSQRFHILFSILIIGIHRSIFNLLLLLYFTWCLNKLFIIKSPWCIFFLHFNIFFVLLLRYDIAINSI